MSSNPVVFNPFVRCDDVVFNPFDLSSDDVAFILVLCAGLLWPLMVDSCAGSLAFVF